MGLDLSECQRGREQNSPLRGCPRNLADGEERLARQRGRWIEISATAVGEQERTTRTAGFRDAVRIGEREQHAGRVCGSLSATIDVEGTAVATSTAGSLP